MIYVGSLVIACGLAGFAPTFSTSPRCGSAIPPGMLLPGVLLPGVGVELTLPTIMASGTRALAPPAFATGSAVIKMMRQTGLVIGVAVFVARSGRRQIRPVNSAFHRGWWVLAAISAIGTVRRLSTCGAEQAGICGTRAQPADSFPESGRRHQ